MNKKIYSVITVILLVATVFSFNVFGDESDSNENEDTITIVLTVEGEIQTEDVWTTGSSYSTNEWAKPMYYIWLDPNGNPNDARYGNGQGPSTHQIRFDTGKLYLEVVNSGITTYGPIYETSDGSKIWSDTENNIQASITNNDKSFEVSFPLNLINNPSTLEISAMCSPWTTSSLDNTGPSSGSSNGWINISDTSIEDSYEFLDVAGETLTWPSSLSNSEKLPNFNIEKLEVTIGACETCGDEDGSITLVSISSPKVAETGPIVSAKLSSTINTTTDVTVDIKVTYMNTGNLLHNSADYGDSPAVSLDKGEEEIIDYELPYSIYAGTPLEVNWSASYVVGGITKTKYYTDYIITSQNISVDDSTGYFYIIDNDNDYNSTLNFDFDNVLPEYQDSIFSSDDGKVKMMKIDYTIHHSPLDISLSSVPVVGDIDTSKLMDLKTYSDTLYGFATAADAVEWTMGLSKWKGTGIDPISVLSAGVDVAYVTNKALNCWASGEDCPEDDWEAFDMLVTWGLGAAVVTGAAIVLFATSPAWVTAGTTLAVTAGTVSLGYNVAKILGPKIIEALEAEVTGGTGEVTDYSTVKQTQSIFIQPSQTEYQMSTGYCNVIGTCNAENSTALTDDVLIELNEKYGDYDAENINVTGWSSAPLSDYVSGEAEGNLIFFEITNEETGEESIHPTFIEKDDGLYIVPYGDFDTSSNLNYEFIFDAQNDQGTAGNPPFNYNSNNQINLFEGGTNSGDLDLHVYADGKHIGVNSETGLMENEIEGAWYSGDADTAKWMEMIILPLSIKNYEVVVDAKDAKYSKEEYTISSSIIKNNIIEDEKTGQEEITKGENKSYDVKVVEENGEISLDTDIGGEEKTTPSKEKTPDIGLFGIILAFALIVLFNIFKRKKFKK